MFQFEPITPRIQRIKDYRKWVNKNMTLNYERNILYTDYYKAHEEEFPMLKRAGALKYWAENCSTPVDDDDIIIAAMGEQTRQINFYVEWTSRWIGPCVNDDDEQFRRAWQVPGAVQMSDEMRETMRDIYDYWRHRDIPAMMEGIMPDEMYDQAQNGSNNFAYRDGFLAMCSKPQGHYVANFRKAVNVGFAAVRDEAIAKSKALMGKVFEDDASKEVFYRAIAITCEAFIILCKRYAQACRDKAEGVDDQLRKAELTQYAESLDWISENPCRTYWEGLEMIALYQAFLNVDAQQHGQSIGRIDAYIGHLLDADLAKGSITIEQAQEMTDAFVLRTGDYLCMDMGPTNAQVIALNESGKNIYGYIGQHMTYTSGEHITVGGVDSEGNDFHNEVTKLILKSYGRLFVPDPTVAIRIHENTPKEIWELAIEASKMSGGMPQFQNDEVIIPALLDRGLSLEDARDYSIVGCVEPAGSGNEWPACGNNGHESIWCMPGCIVMTINGGVNPMNNSKGVPCKKLYEYESFEEFQEAFKAQVEYFLDWQITLCSYYELMYAHYFPCVSASAMMEGCLESGKDATAGGCTYNRTGMTCVGIGNTADSLESIKKLCFDDKSVSLQTMYDALAANWEGYEDLKSIIENDVPHYGNDIEEVDELAAWAMSLFADHLLTRKGPRGWYNGGTFTMIVHLLYGTFIDATPDGRYRGEKLADAISPRQGFDINGPTSYIKSASKLPHRSLSNGDQLNIRFNPKSIEGEEGTFKLRELFETYFELGGMQVQFNMVSTDQLYDAQANPDEYRDLVVRIAGFSAYFVELNKPMQDDFITRTEQSF